MPVTNFYRAINVNGTALTIDGNSWVASSGATNFSVTGTPFANQSVTLSPSTDANRTTMIRSSVYANNISAAMSAMPSGYYKVYIYVWEDNNAETISITVEGSAAVTNYNTGSAGSWAKLGPFVRNVTDGTLNINTSGGTTNLSGIEVWSISTPPIVANPVPDHTAIVGEEFNYTIASNAFTDADPGTTLALSATLSNGSALPSWLSFNATTRKFTGTPAGGDLGTITIRVTATDGDTEVSDDLTLTVANGFYRAINVAGSALSIDGHSWEASSGAANFSMTGSTFNNQSITLIPATDANRATMIRSSAYNNATVNFLSVPAGTYDIYVYTWEDNWSEATTLSIEGAAVLSNVMSGNEGEWKKLGPFRRNITDGAINVGGSGALNISGVEVLRASTGETPLTVTVFTQGVTLAAGQAALFQKYVTPDNGSNQAVTWSSSNTAVATVDATGLVRAVSAGTATITATSTLGAYSGTSTITVTGAGANVLPNPEFDDGFNNWYISDAAGTPANTSTVVQNAGLSGANALYIDIKNTAADVWRYLVWTPLPFRLEVGKTYRISFMAKAQANRNITITMTGSTTELNYSYNVVALTTAAQNLSVTYTCNDAGANSEAGFKLAFYAAIGALNDVWIDKVAVEDVTGITQVSSVSLSPATLNLNVGATGQLTKTIAPSNATNQEVSWTSSNPAVATVDNTGLVTAVSNGTATVTVQTENGGKQATAAVNVSSVAVTGVSVSPASATLSPDDALQLTHTLSPSNATNTIVNWSSSDEQVASVTETGLVWAEGVGTAIITATTEDGEYTATCIITVSYTVNTPLGYMLEHYAFQYKYDGRNRMTHKKVPGAGWIYMVYDDRDRLVLTQDANQREKDPREWTFTKYDSYNRAILTGLYTDSTNNEQIAMQLKVDQFYIDAAGNSDEWFEVRGQSVHGYTNNSFPKVQDSNAYLTVNYYDNYDFMSDIQDSSAYSYDNSQLVASGNEVGQPSQSFLRITGQVTGTKVKNLDSSVWYWTVNYYDDRYRAIQSVADNSKGGINKVTTVYDFVGKVLRSRTDHSVAPGPGVATERRMKYDHAGRLLQTEHKTGGEPFRILTRNDYNELGQLVAKNLNSEDDGTTFKQQVDYRYNIRGWLARINDSELSIADGGPKDYFGMNLAYETDVTGEGFLDDGYLQYNGNISAIKYSINSGLGVSYPNMNIFEPNERIYVYRHDPMSRLSQTYSAIKEDYWNEDDSFSEGGLYYDLNGNILNLERLGKSQGIEIPVIDYLYYTYQGNRLAEITDEGDRELGFIDGNTTETDYLYDANGNMVTDLNKGISTIQYNHLNLPSRVVKNTGDYIKYVYDALGTKLSQQVYDDNDVLVKRSDYVGEYFYENDTLRFVNHEEGRVLINEQAPEYQYYLKDHLGNNRLIFTTKPLVDTFTATMELPAQSGEQDNFGGYQATTNDLLDYTDHGSQYDKVLVLNGGYNGQVGLTKAFAVVPGDTVSASVYAKYLGGPGATSNLANFAAALTSAFGMPTPPVGVDGPAAFEALNGFGALIAGGERDDDDNAPKGFVNILVFNKDYELVDFAFQQIDASYVQGTGAKVFYAPLAVELTIRQPGYAYVFLSNEGSSEQQIGFDDMTVRHAHSDVIQSEEYYPFGLTFNSYQRESSVENRYLYNQGTGDKTFKTERIYDLGLNVDQSKLRTYDYLTGRWWQVDPLADEADFTSLSPYNYSFNNPVRYNDPYGDCPICPAIPIILEGAAVVVEAAMATSAGIALVNLAKSADTGTPGTIYTPAVSFAMSATEPGELSSPRFLNADTKRSASDQKLIDQAKQQKAKEEAAKSRDQKRQQQTQQGKEKEGKSNQQTRGDHNSGNQSKAKKETHENANARRAREQAKADQKKEDSKKKD